MKKMIVNYFSCHAALLTLRVNLAFFYQIKRYIYYYFPINDLCGFYLLILIDVLINFFCHEKRLYMEADMMAKKYKQKLPPSVTTQRLEPLPTSCLPFENEALYANWKWFKFEK